VVNLRSTVAPPTQASRPAAHRAPPRARLWDVLDRHANWVVLGGVLVAAALFLINLQSAPDFGIDETFYAGAGQHIDNYNAVTFDIAPINIHPPLFFLTVAGWLKLTGNAQSPIIDAIHAARYLNALFSTAVVLLVGVLARIWSGSRPSADRGRLVAAAVLLVATNAFLLRFGRIALIEPMGLTVGLLSLVVAWLQRERSTWVYATTVGASIGLAVLVKEPLLFIAAAPLAAAVLRQQRRDAVRHLLAMLVGGLIWLAFPVWAALNHDFRDFADTQTFSIRRLLGLVQVSGLNRPGASPVKAFTDTFWQYSGAYLTFVLGAVVLAARLWTLRRKVARTTLDGGTAQLLGLGLLSYAFLGYSVVVGQSNEQLAVYPVPAAALLALSTGGWARARPVASTLVVASLALGLVSWLQYFATNQDDATMRVEAYVAHAFPACTPVNITGDLAHWVATLRTNPASDFADGPTALRNGVHVFVLSPKDAEFRYGHSSPDFSSWVEHNGRRVYSLPSHTNGSLSVWVVGTVAQQLAGLSPANCVAPLPTPSAAHPSSARLFGGLLAAVLAIDALVGWSVWWGLRRRRRQVRV
jgi:Dolichyl-phosphate-mannose-protein mannosyltransferase